MISSLRRFFVTAGVTLLLALLGYRALGPKGYQEYRRRAVEKQQLDRDVHDLILENIRLKSQAQKLKNDPQAIEGLAREVLDVAKPGEYIYILPAK